MAEEVVPKYKRMKLKDVAEEVVRRIAHPPSSGYDRYVSSSDIDQHDISVQRWGASSDYTASAKLFESGDYLFVRRSLYGSDFRPRAPRASFAGVCSSDILTLREVSEAVYPGYLAVVLYNPRLWQFVKANGVGSITQRIKWRQIAEFEFELPPLDEQKRIAGLLWSVEASLGDAGSVLQCTENLERAFLRETVLGVGAEVALHKLIRSSVGGVWGSDPRTSDVEVSVVRGTDIAPDGSLRLYQAPARSVSVAEASTRTLALGDVLLEKSGGSPGQPVGRVGLCTEVGTACVASNFVVVLKAETDRVIPEYLALMLRAMWLSGQFARFTGKTTGIANLRTRELLDAPVRCPGLDAQPEVVRQHQGIMQIRVSLEKEIEELLTLRRGLLREIAQ